MQPKKKFKANNEKILIVDDDRFFSLQFRSGLELMGFDVEHIFSVDDAINRFNSGPLPDFIIMDLMMPKSWKNHTWDERIIGLYLAREFRKVSHTVPMLIASNAQLSELISQAEDFSESTALCLFVRKFELTPNRLRDILSEWFELKQLKRRSTVANVWKKFTASLLLQPNFGGIGLDIRTFFTKSKR